MFFEKLYPVDYADIVWGDKNNINLMNFLRFEQNNAARLILEFPAQASGTQTFEMLKWQPLHLGTVPTLATEHKCCASRDTRVSMGGAY